MLDASSSFVDEDTAVVVVAAASSYTSRVE